jgi:hypothetical protein
MRDLRATTNIVNEVAREFFYWPRELREIYLTLPAHGTDIRSACKSLDFEYDEIIEMVDSDQKRCDEIDDGSRSFSYMCNYWAQSARKFPGIPSKKARLYVEELEILHFSLLTQVTNIKRVRKGDERVLKDIFKTPDLGQDKDEEETDDESGLINF